MSSARPAVAIIANVDYESPNVQNMNANYIDALYSAGVQPVIIPLPDITMRGGYDAIAEDVAGMFSGVVLAGGDDVDARLYGEENMPFNGSFSEERDLFEISMTIRTAAHRKPILAICRGIQILNVAMGGTLYQDITKQLEMEGEKAIMHAQKAPAHSAVHDVRVNAESTLAGILFERDEIGAGAERGGFVTVAANSFHHQAVKTPAPCFVASARTSDGVIEATEPRPGAGGVHPFTIGVQWHPERMWKKYEHAARVFLKFAEACRGGK
jgi:putative glutamine amidotransferase